MTVCSSSFAVRRQTKQKQSSFMDADVRPHPAKWPLKRNASSLASALGAFERAASSAEFRRRAGASTVEGILSEDALDVRCSLRYSSEVVTELRGWVRTLEEHQRRHGKQWLASIDQQLYKMVFFKVASHISLTISNLPTSSPTFACRPPPPTPGRIGVSCDDHYRVEG